MGGVNKSLRVFTTGQIAKICKVAPRTASKWFDSGKLKGYRIPGSKDRRIPRDNLVQFLREHGMPTHMIEYEDSQVRVLVVTDDARTAEQVKALNSDESPYVVHVVRNAFEAGAYRAVPSVVVIDFAIGRGEAIQLARALRGSIGEQRPAVKYIAIANEDESDCQSLCDPNLFEEVHQKPIDIAALIEGMFVEQGV